ncbi:hypothetical protein ACQKKX_06285 [Neorhizobium sp. NPDC001467]
MAATIPDTGILIVGGDLKRDDDFVRIVVKTCNDDVEIGIPKVPRC